MDVTFLRSERFPGWPEFHTGLDAIQAPEAAVALAKIVVNTAAQSDGVFTTFQDLTATNFHLMQRLLLRRWAAGGWRRPAFDPGKPLHESIDPSRSLFRLLRYLSGLRETHPILDRSIVRPPAIVAAHVLWFTMLEQRFQNRSAKHEVARAWIMYQSIWPQLVASGKIPVAPPYAATAFDSLPYTLFMIMLLYHEGGYVDDARALLAQSTVGGQIFETFRDLYTVPADEFVRCDRPEDYPEKYLNPFGISPILRIDDNRLIAPDPSVLFGGLEFRLLQQVLSTGKESNPANPEDGFRKASSSFGFVFEAYGRALLAQAAIEQVVPEFRYERGGQMVDSPDAFLLGALPLVIEFKSMRYPFDLQTATSLQGLARWLTELTGGKNGRGAFEQGAAFVQDVQSGRCRAIDARTINDALYVIVAYDDIPSCANWLSVRDELWPSGSLSPEAALLSRRTVFISIRDLEAALTIQDFEHSKGRAFSLGDEMRQWWEMVQHGPQPDDARQHRLPDGLGNFLIRRYPNATAHSLELHRTGWNAYQAATLDAGFPKDTESTSVAEILTGKE
ncbi:MAG TPA: hypothetical protein VFP84_16695 [Kofleriaceae bacterium]|nr:hypothetical protein [Kofleriaceae bacterium]